MCTESLLPRSVLRLRRADGRDQDQRARQPFAEVHREIIYFHALTIWAAAVLYAGARVLRVSLAELNSCSLPSPPLPCPESCDA